MELAPCLSEVTVFGGCPQYDPERIYSDLPKLARTIIMSFGKLSANIISTQTHYIVCLVALSPGSSQFFDVACRKIVLAPCNGLQVCVDYSVMYAAGPILCAIYTVHNVVTSSKKSESHLEKHDRKVSSTILAICLLFKIDTCM